MISMVTCDVCTKNNNNDQNENTPITKIPLYDGAKETYEALKENTPLPKNLIDLKIQTKDLIQKRLDDVFEHYEKISEFFKNNLFNYEIKEFVFNIIMKNIIIEFIIEIPLKKKKQLIEYVQNLFIFAKSLKADNYLEYRKYSQSFYFINETEI